MIRYRAIALILSQFLFALATMMLIPFGYGYFTSSDGVWEIGAAALVTTVSSIGCWLISSPIERDLTQREGLLLVVVIWTAIPFFGCLPLYFSPQFSSFTDSFFHIFREQGPESENQTFLSEICYCIHTILTLSIEGFKEHSLRFCPHCWFAE